MALDGFGRTLARMGSVLVVGLAAAGWVLPAEGRAEPATVRITDESKPTRCAEDDNVSIAIAGEGVRSFAVLAEHPRYLVPGMPDQTAPDFTDCDMTQDPAYRYEPFQGVLWDDGRTRIMGYRHESDWRPNQVPVTVAGRTVVGLHLLQMFHYIDGKPVEFLVTYPSDGYWRVKPLPPADRAETAYGTSFLIGPIHHQGRPVVDFSHITIDPEARRYDIAFADGSKGTLSVAAIDRSRAELRVELDRPVPEGRPFATLRSMYVTGLNADATLLGALPAPERAWTDRALKPGEPATIDAVALRLWRAWPSYHNTSAPEVALRDFER